MQSGRSSLHITIEPLGNHHNRAAFTCGNNYIDAQMQRTVLPLQGERLVRAFVAVEPGKSEVLGFYVIQSHEIESYLVPPAWTHLLTDHLLGGIPAAYISLFGTHMRVQGRGIGRRMMADALRRIKKTSDEAMGLYAVVLDAADKKAFEFYLSLGFVALDPNKNMRMFYPVAAIP